MSHHLEQLRPRLLFALASFCVAVLSWRVRAEPLLGVSENQRFLVRADGSPFFYLGDTAWELFHRLSREEIDRYLTDRAAKGFTVIQAVALAELDGLNTPNAYGHLPLHENDPTRPDVKPGPDDDYWDHVDYVVNKAESLGLFIGLLPTWGDKWNKKWGVGPEIFTPENAKAYGEWLGKRYRERPIIWILGGDRPIETDVHRAIIESMARGLRQGDGGHHLITFHPTGCRGSSEWFHEAEWLDFNMRQNGHGVHYESCYAKLRADYDRTPVKPVIDGEPVYEDHPIAFKPAENGHSVAADVRRAMYWDLLSGACGHTYGHHSIWQMAAPGREPVNNPLLPWYEAINQPGGMQMQYGRRLVESRGGGALVPDDSLIVPHEASTAVPGAGRLRMVAAREPNGRCALVYSPAGRPFKVRLTGINGPSIAAWWYNPRSGSAAKIHDFPADGEHAFTPPDAGEYLDWVLVLDSSAEGFPPPGQISVRD